MSILSGGGGVRGLEEDCCCCCVAFVVALLVLVLFHCQKDGVVVVVVVAVDAHVVAAVPKASLYRSKLELKLLRMFIPTDTITNRAKTLRMDMDIVVEVVEAPPLSLVSTRMAMATKLYLRVSQQ